MKLFAQVWITWIVYKKYMFKQAPVYGTVSFKSGLRELFIKIMFKQAPVCNYSFKSSLRDQSI